MIPSVFTPNGDGYNDTWTINGLIDYPFCLMKVYNRWGQLVFNSEGYLYPWDGSHNGNDLPIADYYYTLDLRNRPEVLTGNITIKR